MVDSLLSVFCVILLFLLAYSVGMLLVRGIASWQSGLEKLIFAVPLGMGVISYTILFFGLLRFFQSPLFYTVLGLGILSLPITITDLWRSRQPKSSGQKSPLLSIIVVVLSLLGFFILIAALAPPTEWDALSYHLAGPKTYLRHGRVFYIPYDHHTNFPFLLQMLYGLMLGVKSVGGAKLCHTLCGALMVASVYPFACRYLKIEGSKGRRVGALAALFLATTPMVIWEMTVAYSDLATALYTWLALYALLNARQDTDDTSPRFSQTWLTLSAVLMGFALGTKFTVLAYWLMLMGGMIGSDLVINRRLTPATIRRALWWAAISLAVAAPWYLKTWLYTGNPTYPFLYSIFHGRYWNAANAAQYAADQAHLGGGKSPADLITAPWKATMLPDALNLHFTEYYTFALSPIFVAVVLALPLLGRRLSRPVQTIGWFGAGVVAFWLLSVQQTRYVLPALPALALVCAEAVVVLWEMPGRIEKWAVGALAAATTAWALYLAGGMAFWGARDFGGNRVARPAWPVVSGAESREDYLAHALPGIGLAEQWINASTSPDAKVALFDLTQGFYLDRDYVWAQPDHAAGLLPWDDYRDVDDWLADFKRRGYTTLLLGARDPKAVDDGKRWRALVAEAIQSDKVTLVRAVPAGRGSDGEPIYVRVYQIP